MKKYFLLFSTSLLLAFNGVSQIDPNTGYTPGAIFDTVFDDRGNKYPLRAIQVNPGGNPDPNTLALPAASCQAGYFRLYFATGSGLDGAGSPDIDRRNVLCQVFSDLSCFIKSPLSSPCNSTPNNTTFVNIYVSNSATGSVLGNAGSMYAFPFNPADPYPGITDGMVRQTIVTGVDPYSSIAPPFVVTGANNFYHGIVNVNTSVSWHYFTNLLPPAGTTDMYTVFLHEAMHSLGFSSLIGPNGFSRLGAGANYYSRYDLFLRSSSLQPLLSNTNAPCYNSSLQFNPLLLPAIKPANCTNTTGVQSDISFCGNTVLYVDPTQTVAVYTPTCFEGGGSLSHFEDMCYPTNNPANNNVYFVMANMYNGYKRYPRDEERTVLCDLGYSVTATYPTAALNGFYTYSAGACSGPGIWGVNDGLSGNNFIYTGSPAVNIPISAIIGNDAPSTVSISCVSMVYNMAGITFNIVGGAGAGGTIAISPTGGPYTCGMNLLKYQPMDALGNLGNVTYIFFYIPCINCNPPDPCNIAQNGGFEAPTTATACGGTLYNNAGCWGDYNGTPDVFYRLCSFATYSLPYIPTPTLSIDSWNGAPNNKIVHVISGSGPTFTTANQCECIKNNLAVVPLQSGGNYNINLMAYYSKHNAFGASNTPMAITIASAPNFGVFGGNNMFPTTLNVLTSFTILPTCVNTWTNLTANFTFTPGSNHSCIIVGIDPFLTTAAGNINSPQAFEAFFDDIVIVPAPTSTFSIPSPICTGGSLNNLAQFASPVPGTFSGPGVTFNGTTYDFNVAPNNTLVAGSYPIAFNYTNGLGCPYTVPSVITLTNTPGPFNFTLNPSYCQNTGISNLSVCITPTNYANCGTFTGPGVYNFPNPPFCPLSYGLAFPNVPGNLGVNSFTYAYPNYVLTNTAVPGGTLSCTAFASATTNVIPAITLSITVTPTNGCLAPGQSATLTALSNYSNATYTWVPGNFTGSSVVVSPTTTTIYTVTADNNVCSIAGTTTVNVPPPPQFSNTPVYLCTGQNIFYMENFLAPTTPVGGTWTAPFILIPTGTVGLTAGYLNPTITPLGTQTISYSYTSQTGCMATNFFTVNIVQGFVLNTNGMSTYCSNLAIGALLSASATPSANVTFTWIPGNLIGATQTVAPSNPTTYTVIATNTLYGCQFDATTFVDVRNDCCPAVNYVNAAIISNTFLTGQWAINQNVTVTGSVSLQGEFIIAPNVTITVAPGATLSTDRNGAHLYSCGNMWWGINVMNGGYAWFDGYNVVEDAREAFSSTGSTNTSTVSPTILIRNTTLNRNYYGVAIHNYVVPTNSSPFVIQNSLFTCRDLSITPGSLNLLQWAPATAPVLLASNGSSVLASPYLVGGFTPTNMKAPNANRASFAGVYIENSGVSINPAGASPTYFTIFVGDVDDKNTTYLLFDNLMHGIYGKNSNFRSRNNVFQNTRRFNTGGPGKNFIGGVGIFGINDNTYSNGASNYIGTVDNTPGTRINHFYDCHFGIYAQSIHELNAQYDDYRSTQANPGPTGPLVTGQFGIWVYSNRFKNYQIRNNRIQNINTGVYIAAYPAAINLPPLTFTFGTYFDRIYVTDNFFCPALSAGAPAGTGYINYCVYAVSGISGFSSLNTFYTPGAQLRISTNNMNRVWRGSYVSNFSNKNFTAFTANNNITMVIQPNPPTAQHGIEHLSNTADVVNTNTIVGTGATFSNTSVAGVYRSMNSSGSTQCNSVTSVYAGFEFAGANVGAFWRNNILNTNRRGLQLTNSAILSQQGSFNSPSDNLWQGTWGINNGTWIDNTITTSLSALYVRTNPGTFIPPLPGGLNPSQFYGTPNTLFPANNNALFASCLPVGGGGGCNNCNPTMLSSLESIVQDSVQYLGNINETSEINKNMAFINVINEPTLAVASQTISNFFTSNVLLTRGKYSDIEGNIRQGNFNQASTQLNNLSPSTNIESNYKDFYSILKDYLANGFIPAQENVNLLQIANKCPFVDGAVVYEARSLYSAINEKIIIYNDQNCYTQNEHGGGHDGRMMKQGTSSISNEIAQGVQYLLMPNPASDYLKITSFNADESVKIKITDLAGKLLLEKDLQIKNHFTILELDLLNGMYLVEIAKGKYRENKKVVISK
jgi:hypothetical protein